MTFKLGLTGSIGMGKSTTADMFRAMDIPVWDADETVHRLYDIGGAAVEPVAALVPDVVEAGAISRPALKHAIARDPTILDRLEKIVHPLVARDRATFLENQAAAPLVLLDIPLLFETGADGWLDAVLVVTSDPETQASRVMARPGMTEATFAQIRDRQLPDAEKRVRADHVIETKTLEQTRADVAKLVATLTGKGADDA
ncbi:dephospho-CoA kinase [Roseicyclus sp.]|uniref:dephospho-CoA kinase n=1 Tax=Roseicyclus sp. TaxID=1914329 RepID=UPI003F6D97D7